MSDDSSSSDESPPRRRKRAPMLYRQYEQADGSMSIPRTTSLRFKRQQTDGTAVSSCKESSAKSYAMGPSTNQTGVSDKDFERERAANPEEGISFENVEPGVSCLSTTNPNCNLAKDSMKNQDEISDQFEVPQLQTQDDSFSVPVHPVVCEILNRRAELNVNDLFVEACHFSSSDEDCKSDLSQKTKDSSDSSKESEDVISLGNFSKLKCKFNLDSPLIPNNVYTTKFECLYMVLNFCMEEGISYRGTGKLLKLVNNIFGFDVIPDGIGVYRSLFECDIGMSYHFYCPKCYFYFGTFDKVKVNGLNCPVTGCGRKGNVKKMNDGNFFMYLPLAPQLKVFLESRDTTEELLSYRFRREQSEGEIRDVFDGLLYKKLANGGILSNDKNLSVTMNTDGSPVFKSVANTMWLIQARINELPPEERFDSSNMFLCGVWFGASEPNMNVFLAPYVFEARVLYDQGFKWKQSNGTIITSRVVTLNCCLDSRAKPDVQCFKQLHAYNGCSYCYHPGDLVNISKNEISVDDDNANEEDMSDDLIANLDLIDEPGDAAHNEKKKRECKGVRYCISTNSFPPDRTDEELRLDMTRSHENNVVTRGVKGISVLTLLPDYDMVNSFAIDYMHATLLGVAKMLLKVWVDSKFSKQPYSIRSKLHLINGRLLNYTPPTNISRRPRKIEDFIHWKANELSAWLFYYALCALQGILGDVYLKHFSLLVAGITILCSECILETELDQANRYLLLFARDVEQLYGPVFMVHNVHLLTHLATSVRFNGPCFVFSAFAFETGNGVIVNLVSGTVGVTTQIANKYMTYRCMPLIVQKFSVSDRVKEFCASLVPKRMAQSATKCDGISVLDQPSISPLCQSQRNVLKNANLPLDLICYHRMILNGVMYDSKTYTKGGARSNNSVVKTRNGKFGVIERIIIASKVVYVVLKEIFVESNMPVVKHDLACASFCKHLHVCKLYPFGGYSVIRAKHILQKCIFLKHGTFCYIAEMPNIIEKD